MKDGDSVLLDIHVGRLRGKKTRDAIKQEMKLLKGLTKKVGQIIIAQDIYVFVKCQQQKKVGKQYFHRKISNLYSVVQIHFVTMCGREDLHILDTYSCVLVLPSNSGQIHIREQESLILLGRGTSCVQRSCQLGFHLV